jgi:hypothetical protein
MTATSAVSPGRSASPGSSGSRRNPMVSPAPVTGPFSPKVTWAAGASALSAIAGALPASLAPDTLTTARIATLAGVTEVHHGWRC